MEKKTFKGLMEELAILNKVSDLGVITDHMHLYVDEIAFTLLEGRGIETGYVSYFCDYGAVPVNADRAEILQRLLEANLVMTSVSAPTFSMNFETGHVLLVGRVELEYIRAGDLLKAFLQFSEQAKLWRQTYFLDGVKKSKSSSHRRLMANAEN